MSTKEQKLKAINHFLNVIMKKEIPLDIRKQEMIKIGRKYCRAHPEWSDIWGWEMKPINDISLKELKELLK